MNVFVSRDLPAGSVLRQRLEAAGHTVEAFSLLRFAVVELPTVPELDWLFAYSPRGVDFYLQQAQPPPSVNLGAIGSGTAAAWRDAGFAVNFVGQGQPVEVANAFAKLAAGKRIGFLQAQTSRQTIERALAATSDCRPLVVYRNAIDTGLRPPLAELYVLTSPLNARAALGASSSRAKTPRLLAIGPSTAAEVELLGFGASRFPDEPTEASLAALALELLGD